MVGTYLSFAMRRIFLLASFVLFCSNGLTANGASDSIELDGTEAQPEGKNTDEREDNNNEKMNLMGIDYFGGDKGSFEKNDYSSFEKLNANTDTAHQGNIVVLDPEDIRNYKAEIKAANKAEVLGINPHYYQSEVYPDFGRRFVPQYPYIEVPKKNLDKVKPNNLRSKLVPKKNAAVVKPKNMTPKLVSPELFTAVAQKSALLDAVRPRNDNDELVRKNILRNGDYWNAVWKEDVDPLALRTKQTKKLESVKAEIPPGSKLHDLLSKLKHLSPTLLYVINERDS